MTDNPFVDARRKRDELDQKLVTGAISVDAYIEAVKEIKVVTEDAVTWRPLKEGGWEKLVHSAKDEWVPGTPDALATLSASPEPMPDKPAEAEEAALPALGLSPSRLLSGINLSATAILGIGIGGLVAAIVLALVAAWLLLGKGAGSERDIGSAGITASTLSPVIAEASTDTPVLSPPPVAPSLAPKLELLAPTSTAIPTPEPNATSATTRIPSPQPTATPTATTSITPPQPTATATATYTSPPQPQANWRQGLLAYTVYDPTAEIPRVVILSLTTSQVVREIDRASQPALKPDGSELAYRSWVADKRGLRVDSLKSPEMYWQPSRNNEASHPAWRPDGGRIVFASNQSGDRIWQLYFPVNEETAEPIPNTGHGHNPTWLNDDQLIFRGCNLQAQCGIALISIDGSGFQLLTQGDDWGPAVSPDRTHIAFMRQTEGQWDIWLMNSDGSNPKPLTSDASRDGVPTWSPDGNRIAFVSNRDGGWAIWSMQCGGSDLQKLLDLGGTVEGTVPDAMAHEQQYWTAENISWVKP
jgi:hypothetical protein